MSKPLTFFMKIKLFILYLRQQQDGVIVDCGVCGSTNINFKSQSGTHAHNPCIHKNNGKRESIITYESKYTCNKCGAICENKQKWFLSENKKHYKI